MPSDRRRPGARGAAVGYVDDALRRGARALLGARRGPAPGRFYRPMLLVGVRHAMACMREPARGAVLAVMAVESGEEAVALANDRPPAALASVWMADRRRGLALACALDASAVPVNDGLAEAECGIGEPVDSARAGSASRTGRRFAGTHASNRSG